MDYPDRNQQQFTVVVTGDGEFLVATCEELGIAAQGGTREEALESLREALALFLDDEPIVLPHAVIAALKGAGYHGVNKRGRHIKFRRYGRQPDTLVLPNEARLADRFIDLILERTGLSRPEFQALDNGG
jgi:predicted RNase H-like HicB family nuclease